jgi:hypothetical protein
MNQLIRTIMEWSKVMTAGDSSPAQLSSAQLSSALPCPALTHQANEEAAKQLFSILTILIHNSTIVV